MSYKRSRSWKDRNALGNCFFKFDSQATQGYPTENFPTSRSFQLNEFAPRDRQETYRCRYGLVGLRVDDRPDRSGNWFSSFCWLPLLFSLVQNDLENDLWLDPKPKLFKNFLPTKYEQKNRKIISTNIYSITTRDITYLSSTSFMFDLR